MIFITFRFVIIKISIILQENDLKPEFKLKVAEWEVRKALAGHSNKVRMVMVALVMKGRMVVSSLMMVATNRHQQNRFRHQMKQFNFGNNQSIEQIEEFISHKNNHSFFDIID